MNLIFDDNFFKGLNWGSFFGDMLLFILLINFGKPLKGSCDKQKIAIHKPLKSTRQSLLMQTVLVFLSMARHILMAVESEQGEIACAFIGFYRYFIDHVYIFYSLAIAVNLHVIYLNSFESTTSYRTKLWLAPVFVALLVDLISYGNFEK